MAKKKPYKFAKGTDGSGWQLNPRTLGFETYGAATMPEKTARMRLVFGIHNLLFDAGVDSIVFDHFAKVLSILDANFQTMKDVLTKDQFTTLFVTIGFLESIWKEGHNSIDLAGKPTSHD